MEQKPTKWEYLTVQLTGRTTTWNEQLEWQGHSEWELVQVLPIFDGETAAVAIFKRPVRDGAAVGDRPDHDPDGVAS